MLFPRGYAIFAQNICLKFLDFDLNLMFCRDSLDNENAMESVAFKLHLFVGFDVVC